jgi:AraC family transcriptional regulator of adaptative response/methylated-DNA-[protein]-cysteine methyltransferase
MQTTDYLRVAAAIRYLDAHADERPTLDDLARHVGLSPFHFQRLFRRWAGVSPKRLLQYQTTRRARAALQRGRPALAAAWEAGLSGPGRLHDLLVSVDAVTPGQEGARGAGLTLAWGAVDTPFGRALLAVSERGIAALEFGAARADFLARLGARWPRAAVHADRARAAALAARAFGGRGGPPPLHVTGTNFQLKGWEALLAVPEGTAVTYGDLAHAIGRPTAARAVGQAVGANAIAWLIPCHRVLRESGLLGGYRWGEERKLAMRAWEELQRSG